MVNSLYSVRQEIVEVGKRMYARNYVASNDGNISARLEDDRILVTPSGVSKGFMKPEDLIVMTVEGKVLSGIKKPSTEVLMHLNIYKERQDVMSVCHAHPPYATGFAVAGISLDKCILPEVIISLGSVPLIEYGTPGTEEIYKPIIKFIKDNDAFLLQNHGALTVGKDVFSAYYKMETVEHFAHILFIAKLLGNTTVLTEDQKKTLIQQREKFGVTITADCDFKPNNSHFIKNPTPEKLPDKELIKKITDEVITRIRK